MSEIRYRGVVEEPRWFAITRDGGCFNGKPCSHAVPVKEYFILPVTIIVPVENEHTLHGYITNSVCAFCVIEALRQEGILP